MSYSGYTNYEEPAFSPYKEEQWTYEDNPNENVPYISLTSKKPCFFRKKADECGFEDKSFESGSLFELKPSEIPKFPKSEQIRLFEVTETQLLLISASNKILRWKLKDPQAVCTEYDLPETKDENTTFLQQINPGNMIMNVMRKLPFSEKKEALSIDRLFCDSKGLHCILASDKGENFYFGGVAEKVRYLAKLKGFIVTSVSWNEESTEENTKDLLVGTRDGGVYLYKVENFAKNGEICEENPKNLASLPGNKMIESLEVF